MKGKEKCKALKEIRQKIAEENDIAYVVSECTHQGDCRGTCPKCEAELRYLERELARREKLGKAVAVAGVAFTICTGLTACESNKLTVNQNDYNGGLTLNPAFESSEEIMGDTEDPNKGTESIDPENYAGGLEEIDPDQCSEECSSEDCGSEEGSPEEGRSEECSIEEASPEVITELEGDLALWEPDEE